MDQRYFIFLILTKTIHDDDIDIQVSNWNSSIEEVQIPSVIPEKIYEAGGSIWCPHFKEITKDSLLAAEKYNLLVFAILVPSSFKSQILFSDF